MASDILMPMINQAHIAMARKTAKNAYAPYSKYRVGAVLAAADGTLFTGCNVENAAYGSTMCAERVALFKAVSEGRRKFTSLTLAAGTDSIGVPCGACLQVLAEFCDGDMPVICAGLTGKIIRAFRLRDLLPHAFTLGIKKSSVVIRQPSVETAVSTDD